MDLLLDLHRLDLWLDLLRLGLLSDLLQLDLLLLDLLVDLPVPTLDADVVETGALQGEAVEEVEAEKRGAGEDREASLVEVREEDLEEEGVVAGESRERPSSSTA